MRSKGTALLTVAVSVLLSACSSGGGKPAASTPAASAKSVLDDPVTLKVLTNQTQDDFNRLVGNHVKNKYPQVTFEVQTGKGGPTVILPPVAAGGNIPDLIMLPGGHVQTMKDLGLVSDLMPAVKANNLDLSRIKPDLLDFVKSYSDKNELLFLPQSHSSTASLLYNKDIFDKFGVKYPRDGMTWDEVYELAKQMTRNEGGIQYRGFDIFKGYFISNNQLSLPFVDPKTNKATLNTEEWKNWVNTMRRFYEIPGNQVSMETVNKTDVGAGPFLT